MQLELKSVASLLLFAFMLTTNTHTLWAEYLHISKAYFKHLLQCQLSHSSLQSFSEKHSCAQHFAAGLIVKAGILFIAETVGKCAS